MDAPTATNMSGLASVLLHMRTLNTDALAVNLYPSLGTDRFVVLTRLKILGHIRVEIVLSVEYRSLRNCEVECLSNSERKINYPLIQHRERAGKPQTDWADIGIGLRTKLVSACAEKFCFCCELDMDL
ncbi:unannotated protein [freshwater metagenome]|uniref:Unannotated protein n=1 Tax=freshwater metagenome TaxID=449393 RepID=A0A6J6VF68_9ZZZZ